MYLTIFKLALVAFICIGMSVMVIAYLRRVKKAKLRFEANPDLGYLSNLS
jgi:hypothetical protein